MRRLKFSAGAGHLSRLDRRESKAAIVVGWHARISGEAGLESLVLHVVGVSVFSDANWPARFPAPRRGRNFRRHRAHVPRWKCARPKRPAPQDCRYRSSPYRAWKNGPTVCDVVICKTMLFLHGCGFASAQNNVEAIAERPFRQRRFPVENRDQPVACRFIRRAIENRIDREAADRRGNTFASPGAWQMPVRKSKNEYALGARHST